jgi:hypothetical protein
VAEPENPQQSFVQVLLREEAGLLPRLVRVLRLDAGVYAEIEQDPHATLGAFSVVMATAVAWGIGQTSLALVFLWIAGALFVWGISTALIWAVATLYVPERADYARLLRCLGFAFAWNLLQLGSGLPLIGGLLQWAGLLLWSASIVLATRQVLALSTGPAAAVCAVALAIPLILLMVGAG